MQTSQRYQVPENFHMLYHRPEQETDSCCFTLDSSMGAAGLIVYDSPAVSVSSNRGPFSPQGSVSTISDPHHSSDTTYGSSLSGSTIVDYNNEYELKRKLRELEDSLLGPESDTGDSSNCGADSWMHQPYSMTWWQTNQKMEAISRLGLGDLLMECAQAVYNYDRAFADHVMRILEQKVSVCGSPLERLGAYMLEGLRARLVSSGTQIYKALKCKEPTSSELMSYMSVLYTICPFWKFAYTSANVVIQEAIGNEPKIHIIDFQIAQGTQWMFLLPKLASRPGGPPSIRITGIDDSQSAHARGGGLDIVGQKLANLAASLNMPFAFHGAGMCGSEIQLENLMARPGEAIVVNFPFVLHHIPDESVSTDNHRDRILQLVRSLSPKVVTLVEQESNTNTSPFDKRFCETLEYYNAMFESIEASGRPRDDKQRINAEQNCVARDIVNMIACEGVERVERHEPFGKWKLRMDMAGFRQHPLSSSATAETMELLRSYNKNYRLQESNGALFLGWKNKVMATSSAWK